MSRLARLLVAVALVVVAAGGVAPEVARAQDTTTAIIVIDNGSSRSWTPVDVGSGERGLDALQQAATVESAPFGGIGVAICSIDGVGNPPDKSCLIGPAGKYWAYWRSSGGSAKWSYSGAGATQTTVHGGDVEGWSYGTGAAPASSASFCSYVPPCAPPPTDPPPPPQAAAPPAADGGTGSSTATDPGTAATSTAPTTANGKAKPGDIAAADAQGDATTSTSDSTAKTGDGTSTTDRTAPMTRTSGNGRQVALGAGGSGGDGGNGSPAGVAIVAGILALVAVASVLVRRSRRGASG
ncbi:MAG: hypothetical protein ACHQIG_10835 [Acidimicrobiia bacterium]